MTINQEEAKLVVQVRPNASRNEVTGFEEGVLSIKIAAPPVKGKANQELIRYLSDILGIPKNQLVIQKGATARRKTLGVIGFNQDQLAGAINYLLKKDKS